MLSLFDQILCDYKNLEPEGSDTWNPLMDDNELFHRTALFREITWALRRVEVEISKLSILDVGCGNGRSSRMYLELGALPMQITGIDMRHESISWAKKIHPQVTYLHSDGFEIPLQDKSFEWISLCTVMSSILSPEARNILAREIFRVLSPGGHLFYWDLKKANLFAGGDMLYPEEIFSDLLIISSNLVSIHGAFEDIVMPGRARKILKLLLRRYIKKPNFCSMLFSKP